MEMGIIIQVEQNRVNLGWSLKIEASLLRMIFYFLSVPDSGVAISSSGGKVLFFPICYWVFSLLGA